MWLVGIRLWIENQHAISYIPSLLSNPLISLENLAIARQTTSIVVSFTVLVAFFLLRRLFGTGVALLSTSFIAFDPIFLAQSRRLTSDALATGFLLIAILTLLLYFEVSYKRRYLFFSGIAFGLACLSKSHSLILLSWVPFVFGSYFHNRRKAPSGSLKTIELPQIVYALLGWFFTSFLTFTALWPFFWGTRFRVGAVSIPLFGLIDLCLLVVTIVIYRELHRFENGEMYPAKQSEQYYKKGRKVFLGALGLLAAGVCPILFSLALKSNFPVLDRIFWAIRTPHEVEHFFLGQVIHNPGWVFYPLQFLIKSGPLTLLMASLGLAFLWHYRHQPAYTQKYRIALALLLFVVLFNLCLSVTAKKFSRYLLPAFPALDVLAAIGLYTIVKWFFCRIGLRQNSVRRKSYRFALLSILVLIQAIPVLSLHPYYGTYYNPCWRVMDITKVCTIGDASGLDLAAKYLNEKPNAKNMIVQVSPLSTEFFNYYFIGRSYGSNRIKFKPDYEVVYIRDSQIGRVPQVGTRNGKLEHVITLNGIEYAWIYRVENSG